MTNMEQLKFKQKMARFPRSKIWDTATQQNIDAVRAFIHRHPQPTITEIQSANTRERALKGPFNLVQAIFPAPAEDDVRQLLFRTINDLGEAQYEPPTLAPVPVEWIGKKAEPVGNISTAVSNKSCDLEQLSKDCNADLTILYVHGGGFLYGSTHCLFNFLLRFATATGVLNSTDRRRPVSPIFQEAV